MPLFALLMLSLPAPAFAQEAEPAPPPAYSTLADVLEDETARRALIEDLRRLAAPAVEEAAEAAAAPDPSLARQIATMTKGIAEQVIVQAQGVWTGLTEMFNGGGRDLAQLSEWAANLAIVIATVLVLFFVLRRAVRPAYARADRWVMAQQEGERRWVHRIIAIGGTALLDLVVVLVAWVGGYVLALTWLGTAGRMETAQSLFLNAFLIIEIVKLGMRGLFASRYQGLRILPLPAEDAAIWNILLARLVGLIGYGMLFVSPVVTAQISWGAGRAVAVLVMLLAFLYALTGILAQRKRVRDALTARAGNAKSGFTGAAIRLLARTWHVFAILYFAALALVTIVRPGDALPFMASATFQTLAAVAGGFVAYAILERLIMLGVRVPEETRRRLPQLERRLNTYIPTGLRVVRTVVVVVVLALIAAAWEVWDVAAWMASERGSVVLSAAIDIAVIVVLAAAVWIAVASWVEHRLSPETGTGEPGAREKTLLAIFRNAFSIVLITMTAMIVMSEMGIDIGPLIAGAGVLGLAIGFGSQKLVQDIITGVFIQLENAINTGDVVTVGGISGTVEKLTIRSIGIRDLAGSYHIIPFSSVDLVTNFMRDFAFHVGEYGIAYRENVDDAIERLKEAFEELRANPDNAPLILDDLEVSGVVALADSSVNIRVRIKTAPGSQWAIGRAYNKLVKQHFDAAGIEIPFPHMTLYFGQDKDGSAPPVPLPQPVIQGKAAE
ncbi:Potassium efflux system KefA protein [Caenispirillum salinarum AK4]|uniref:Potassium efflux system KefA protein n=2 Tax=Caenispirillum TaxID=414051 RepID=K9GUY7_9PROT|nr:Potassium efflux system KefA protein [Caenispirillum salinarum AK4]